jgi:hypothetical protein
MHHCGPDDSDGLVEKGDVLPTRGVGNAPNGQDRMSSADTIACTGIVPQP